MVYVALGVQRIRFRYGGGVWQQVQAPWLEQEAGISLRMPAWSPECEPEAEG